MAEFSVSRQIVLSCERIARKDMVLFKIENYDIQKALRQLVMA